MKPVFISYSRKDVNTVREIANTLTMGGIRAWQDLDELSAGPTDYVITNAIREECSGLLCYITPNSLESAYVCKLELNEAHEKHLSDPGFPIIPMYGMEMEEANRRLTGTLHSMGSFSGVNVGDHPNLAAAAQKAKQMLLSHLLKPLKGRVADIALSTWQPTLRSLDLHLDLDWSGLYSQGHGELFRRETWSEKIEPALVDLKHALRRAGCSRLRVHPNAHLTAGFAFGSIFRKEADVEVEVMQKGDCWASDAVEAEDTGLRFPAPDPGPINSNKLALVASITQNAKKGFNSFASSTGIQFRSVIHCAPPVDQWSLRIRDGSHALAIAKQIRQAVVNERSRTGCTELHVFAAIPFGLAFLIGRELNACGAVQLYEHDKGEDVYAPSWMLK